MTCASVSSHSSPSLYHLTGDLIGSPLARTDLESSGRSSREYMEDGHRASSVTEPDSEAEEVITVRIIPFTP